jgi:cytoplasmic iron level regulating protein YaaA (DUF328/UPF0246 family)
VKSMLLISCSQTKKPIPKGKAIDLYDGPYYRVIRKLRKEGLYPVDVDVYILSAKYGIIHEDTEIDSYDMRMSLERALELRVRNLEVLGDILKKSSYGNMMINLGKTYMESIQGYERYIGDLSHVEICSGQIGERISQMKQWLLRFSHKTM